MDGEKSEMRIPKGYKLCSQCGKVKKESTFTSGNSYCNRCREELLFVSLPWQYVITVALLIFVSVFSVFFLSKTADLAAYAVGAVGKEQKGSLFDSIDMIETAEMLTDKLNGENTGHFFYSAGNRAARLKLELYARAYSTFRAGAAVSVYFTDEQLETDKNATFREYKKYYDAYKGIADSVGELLSDYSAQDEIPYSYIVSEIDSLVTEKSSDYEKGFAEYFKAEIMSYSLSDETEEYSTREIIAQAEKAKKYFSDGETMFLSVYIDCLKHDGNYSELADKCDMLIKINNNNSDAYFTKVYALCMQDKYSAAIDVCEEMSSFNPETPELYAAEALIYRMSGDISAAGNACLTGVELNGDAAEKIAASCSVDSTRQQTDTLRQYVELLYQQSVVYLLKGEYADAYESAYTYGMEYVYTYYSNCADMDVSELSEKICSVAALSAALCGEDDALEEIKGSVKLSAAVQNVIDGKLSLEELFVKGKERGLLD